MDFNIVTEQHWKEDCTVEVQHICEEQINLPPPYHPPPPPPPPQPYHPPLQPPQPIVVDEYGPPPAPAPAPLPLPPPLIGKAQEKYFIRINPKQREIQDDIFTQPFPRVPHDSSE